MRPGAEKELEALYRRYRGDVYRYALLVSRDEDEADEVTQTAFLSAYRALARGGYPRSPRAWLLAIAENARRRRQRRPHEVPLPESYEAPAPEPEVSAAELVAAIGALPDPQRRALLLREFSGRSYGEIADALETSVGAVQMLLFRARRELRERLKRVAGIPAPFWADRFGTASPALRAGAAAAGAVVLALGAGGAAPTAAPEWDGPQAGLRMQASVLSARAARTPQLSALTVLAGGAAVSIEGSAPAGLVDAPGATPATAPESPASPGAGPESAPPSAAPPPAALPPGVQPPGVQPPGLQPPGVQPPGAQPLGVQPPGVQPPGVQPPGVQPPAVQPPAVQPPTLDPGLLPVAEPAPAPPLPPPPPAPALPALPPNPFPPPPVPPTPVLEPPALPEPPQLPEAPTLPELGGAQLPQPSPPSRSTTAESARPLLP